MVLVLVHKLMGLGSNTATIQRAFSVDNLTCLAVPANAIKRFRYYGKNDRMSW
jgi:hypothetical protein